MSDNGRPHANVPLEAWVEAIIDRALAKHQDGCPVRARVEKLEIRLASLVAFMAGSGLLGGVAGALVSRLFGGGA